MNYGADNNAEQVISSNCTCSKEETLVLRYSLQGGYYSCLRICRYR
jgi:hypothetical protein